MHFVADRPDPRLVTALAAAFAAARGALLPLYEVLPRHPGGQDGAGGKVRHPFDFLVASLSASGLSVDDAMGLTPRQMRTHFYGPLRVMGQSRMAPRGPGGWSEAASDWIVPQLLAARIDWAMRAPIRLTGALPDPRAFLDQALGGRVYGRWPGLENLCDGRDLMPTGDVRAYAGWAMAGLFGLDRGLIARSISAGLDPGHDPGLLR